MRSCVLLWGVLCSLSSWYSWAGGGIDWDGDVEFATTRVALHPTAPMSEQPILAHMSISGMVARRLHSLRSPYVICPTSDRCSLSLYRYGSLVAAPVLPTPLNGQTYITGIDDSSDRQQQGIRMVTLQFNTAVSERLLQFFEIDCNHDQAFDNGDVSCRCTERESNVIYKHCSMRIFGRNP